jgi:hypothetical protein
MSSLFLLPWRCIQRFQLNRPISVKFGDRICSAEADSLLAVGSSIESLTEWFAVHWTVMEIDGVFPAHPWKFHADFLFVSADVVARPLVFLV